MSELSQAPVCEKHGCEKVWIRDKHRKATGGFWRCRECNNEQSRARNARNQANAEKREQLKAYYRERWAKLPQEERDTRNQQIIAQKAVRRENDPEYRRRETAHNAAWRKRNEQKNRNSNLKKTYGITQADYERMLAEQGGGCAICGSTKPNGRSKKYLHVDHCHETGLVRGVLCSTCNSGLGSFSDNVSTLEQAVLYLRKHAVGASAA